MQQLNFCVRRALHRLQQRGESDRAHINNGMMHPRVLHAEDHLKNQTAFRDHSHQALHRGMVEIERLIAGINPNARHFVNLVTAPDILLPIRPRQVDAAKRNQKTRRMLQALGRQTRIDPTQIFGEQRLETASPGLDDPMFLELCCQGLRVAVFQRAERPTEKIHIGVDDSRGLGGADDRGVESRSLCRQWWMAGERNSRHTQQGIPQKTAAIDGFHRSLGPPILSAHRDHERWGETPSSPDLQWIEIRARRSLTPPGSWVAEYSMLSVNQGSIFMPFFRKMGAQILRRFPPKIFIRSAFEISASKTLPSSVA